MPTSDSAEASPKRQLTPIKWAFPVIVMALLGALFTVMYIGYIVNPEKNLHDFPVALVNQDVGDMVGPPGAQQQINFGNQVADGLRKAVPADQIALRVLGINEAQLQMQQAKVYGTIIIPSDFSKRLGILGVGSVVSGQIERPTITLQTNPRTGAFATAVLQRFGDQALSQVDAQVGQQLTQQVKAQLAAPPGGPPAPELSGATMITLEHPLNIVTSEFRPLPSGSGQGLTAFFYTLLLVVVGMVGAMVIHQLIDSALGFLPTEWGPWYVHYPRAQISRFTTLLIKWAAVLAMALSASGIIQGVGVGLGMSVDKPLQLFLYGAFVILAVGVTCTAVLALVGSSGLIFNLIVFIVLGIPTSGGSIPLEAAPKYMSWFADFIPMHQAFMGIRSILYFDGDGSAGLTRGVWMTLLGLAIGIVIGIPTTRFYDRKGLQRKPIDLGGKHSSAD